MARLVRRDEKAGIELPDKFSGYLDSGDYNRKFYRNTSEDDEATLKTLLEDAEILLQMTQPGHADTQEYRQLARCLGEQTTVEEGAGRQLRQAGDPAMHSGILQTPVDEDATYRKKAGREHIGYAMNTEETVGENGSVVTDWDVQRNNYSDSEFLRDNLASQEAHEDPVTLVVDGAYGGQENEALAEEKNVKLVATGLAGKEPDPVFGSSEFDASGLKVTGCPAGHAPTDCGPLKQNGRILVRFERDHCAECPHRNVCRAKVHKNHSSVDLSVAGCSRARKLAERSTEEFSNLSRVRNGAEAVPSAMRRDYDVDHMPIRGLTKIRLAIDAKVGALNFRKFLRFCSRRDDSAQNPVLIGN